MKALLMPWWRDLSRREQWLVALAGVLLVIVLVWMALLRPLAAARATAEARYDAAMLGLAEVSVLGNRVRVAQSRGVNSRNLPLIELVGDRARAAELTVESLSPVDGGQVAMRIAAVRPAVLLRWISEIERGDGLVVERVMIRRNEDATVAVDLALRRGGQ
jgi:general secretion pathway protein M